MGSLDSLITTPKKGKGLVIPLVLSGSLITGVAGVVERGIKLYDYIRGLEKRIQKLERYKCVQGWNPPITKDSDRICEEEE